MSGRPKQPKYARNKNILVIGRLWFGQDEVFCKTQPDADALIVCCHRSERITTIRVERSRHSQKRRLHTMKKQTEKDKLTALYERLSHDDGRAGKAYLSRTRSGFWRITQEKTALPISGILQMTESGELRSSVRGLTLCWTKSGRGTWQRLSSKTRAESGVTWLKWGY